jgi:hypothetical protein
MPLPARSRVARLALAAPAADSLRRRLRITGISPAVSFLSASDDSFEVPRESNTRSSSAEAPRRVRP